MQRVRRILVLLSMMTAQGYAAEEVKPKVTPLPEISIGKKTAPIVVINYSSLTCSHCAQFHLEVLPKIEEKYIKPGKVRIIFRGYPANQVDIVASQLVWCMGAIKYLDFVKLLYSTQEKWLDESDPIATLKSIMTQRGVSAEQLEACIKDHELLDKIIQVRLEGQENYPITSTPTIIINAMIYPRALTFEEFEEIVTPLLAPAVEQASQKG